MSKISADTKTEKTFYLLYVDECGNPTWASFPLRQSAEDEANELLASGEADGDEDIKIVEAVTTLTRKVTWE